jgi:lysyl-tRNA synthetase, class II
MLEFYQAYADYHDLMALTEEMLRALARQVLGSLRLTYQGEELDISKPFGVMTVKDAILRFNPGIGADDLASPVRLREVVSALDIPVKPGHGPGRLVLALLDKTVEPKLREPTFITGYPVEVSPLARRNDQDLSIADRFELYIGGREIANGFTELNDPEDQAERFRRQVADKEAGDEEAMHFDADYIRALEHGMPPTAGEGIGIDRLVMLFTDSASIRDVLLFPHVRPEPGGV